MPDITRCAHCGAIHRDGKHIRLSDTTRTMLRLAARDKRGEVQWNSYANMETLVTQGLIERLEGMMGPERSEADRRIMGAMLLAGELLDRIAADNIDRDVLHQLNRCTYDAIQIEHKKTAVWYQITDAGRKVVSV